VSGACSSPLHPVKYYTVPIGSGAGWAPKSSPRSGGQKNFEVQSGSFMLSGSEVNYCAWAVKTKIHDRCFDRELLFGTSGRYSAARVGGRLSESTAVTGSADR
jgi:hypothetical protein